MLAQIVLGLRHATGMNSEITRACNRPEGPVGIGRISRCSAPPDHKPPRTVLVR